ncbi:MAG: hypothetical protein KJZ65_00835 [Phycisphaerales bacterium]|nr:hypothetical protein [Phycisphaerales bacterium]
MRRGRANRRGGFTILELGVVVVIVAVLAASAIPAFEQVRLCRQGGARSEVLSLLRSARAHAMTLGDPCGLEIDVDAARCALWTIVPGGAPVALLDPLGAPDGVIELGVIYPGVRVASVKLADGSGGSGVIWFSNTGTPELHDEDGVYVGAATHDAEIVIGEADAIVVQHRTGGIE